MQTLVSREVILIFVRDAESAKAVPNVIRIDMLIHNRISVRARESHFENWLGPSRLLPKSNQRTSPSPLSLKRIAVPIHCKLSLVVITARVG
jgi:hypothetical protein